MNVKQKTTKIRLLISWNFVRGCLSRDPESIDRLNHKLLPRAPEYWAQALGHTSQRSHLGVMV